MLPIKVVTIPTGSRSVRNATAKVKAVIQAVQAVQDAQEVIGEVNRYRLR